MTFLKLVGKISIISGLLLGAFLLAVDQGQTSSTSTTVSEQKLTPKISIFNTNINSKLKLIERPWLIAQRQSRVALVIGNGSYEEAPLRNPINDATDMAAALKRLGFELIDNRALLNLNKRQMEDAIDKFRERLRQGGGVGVFYYAGHGVAIEGVNYLIPINADLDVKKDVQDEAIRLRKIINNMQITETQFNFIIVDACRDNPIYRQWPADSRSGRTPQGLAEEKETLARGTLIFYSARYGRTASDGKGRNSPFTFHLLRHIETPNLRIVDLTSKVADDVEKETDSEQVPWQEGSIRGGAVYLSRIEDNTAPSSPQASPSPTTVAVPQPTPSPSPADSQPGTTLISKATGVDYSPLRDLLFAGRWREADSETTRAMIQAAGREKEGWLRTEDIDEFSCEDLRIIDQLWLDSSKGKFGFSVQKDIYQNLGGTREYNREVWQRFGTQVGWRQGDSWGNYSDLTFNLNAPKGQLPGLFYVVNDSRLGNLFLLAQLPVTCKI